MTGLRNPCVQIEDFHTGALAAVLGCGPDGGVVRKSGVMAVVVTGGVVRSSDAIVAELPPEPHKRLEPV